MKKLIILSLILTSISINLYSMNKNEEEECSICLGKIILKRGEKGAEEITILACLHYFHSKCIREWEAKRPNAKCPICNANIKDDKEKEKIPNQPEERRPSYVTTGRRYEQDNGPHGRGFEPKEEWYKPPKEEHHNF